MSARRDFLRAFVVGMFAAPAHVAEELHGKFPGEITLGKDVAIDELIAAARFDIHDGDVLTADRLRAAARSELARVVLEVHGIDWKGEDAS